MTVIVSPVGADADLRAALEDLRLGRYAATRDLLRMTGQHWALRTSRSQILAAVADPGVFKMWHDEEPHHPDAAMMWARALSRAAVDAFHSGKSEHIVGRAARMAAEACQRASDLLPACPVPWIDRLQLTQLPFRPEAFDPHAHLRPQPWNMLPAEDVRSHGMYHPGPWPLLREADRRDPGSREAHHQMRQALMVHSGLGAARDFSFWIVSKRLRSLELLMLPLYAIMDKYRAEHGSGQFGALQFWQRAQVGHYACQAYDRWFADIPADGYPWLSMTDLSHLAHALVATGENQRAAAVFRAMGPYATAQPWQDVNASLGRSRDWRDWFVTTRDATLRRWPEPAA
ncbi:MAG: hypothetical protein JF597_42665 [Streptomyces sp.]|uniref:hypothetical protein n=1 Tax=Streptomyces sp. TaxID=1931 RepID=UPI0025D86442|nr:hypothetical protein [Streptomyces sp.]MBW8800054.1 hypothetical protein [Streptomyces sp.]